MMIPEADLLIIAGELEEAIQKARLRLATVEEATDASRFADVADIVDSTIEAQAKLNSISRETTGWNLTGLLHDPVTQTDLATWVADTAAKPAYEIRTYLSALAANGMAGWEADITERSPPNLRLLILEFSDLTTRAIDSARSFLDSQLRLAADAIDQEVRSSHKTIRQYRRQPVEKRLEVAGTIQKRLSEKVGALASLLLQLGRSYNLNLDSDRETGLATQGSDSLSALRDRVVEGLEPRPGSPADLQLDSGVQERIASSLSSAADAALAGERLREPFTQEPIDRVRFQTRVREALALGLKMPELRRGNRK
jgi:hypothetical protein